MPTRFLAVDCLRGFAAVWVVLFHLWVLVYPNLNTQEHSFIAPQEGADVRFWLTYFTCQYGYVGVTLFFVLSGFCIHLPFARQPARPLRLGEFYSRRFWRLYPAYLASIVLVMMGYALTGMMDTTHSVAEPSHDAAGMSQPDSLWQQLRIGDAAVCALFLQNFHPPAFQFNPVYWTLLYEVQFYLLYPLVLVLVRQRGAGVVLLGCLVIEAVLTYYPLPVRAICLNGYYEWFLGAFVAELWVKGKRIDTRMGWTLTILLGLLFVVTTFHPRLWLAKDMVAATAFACMLWTILGTARDAGDTRPTPVFVSLFAWLGLISYSLYLVHLPIITFCWQASGQTMLFLISLPASLLIAWLFFKRFEEPFLHMK